MYSLTLTEGERSAFNWVGKRYATGYDASSILSSYMVGEHTEWLQGGDVSFEIPEHAAWAIAELAEQEGNLWPCFSHGLKAKMTALVDSIV